MVSVGVAVAFVSSALGFELKNIVTINMAIVKSDKRVFKVFFIIKSPLLFIFDSIII